MTRESTIIQTPEALAAAIGRWQGERELAVDTESNSFFVYREVTCLVQVSTRDADWIVDPLAVDFAPFARIAADPAIEKVFHAAEYDVVSLKRDYGFVFHNLYDTLIAAKAVGRKKLGLGNLIEEVLGTKLAKDEQRSDWGRRPLTPDQIEYAFSDTRYLLSLADALKQDVATRGPDIVEEVATDCRRMTEKEPRPREVDVEAFEKLKTARGMEPVSRQILKSLYEAREARAREMNRPVFRVIQDQTLGEIAVRKPQSRAELQKVPGVTPPILSRHGDMLLEAVRAGIAAGPLPFRRRAAPPQDEREEELYEALRAWRRATAEARGVEVDVIIGNAALRTIARARPADQAALDAVAGVDAFRTRRYGAAILAVVSAQAG